MTSRDRRYLLATGKYVEAEDAIAEALRERPTCEAHLDSARLHLALNEPERAARHLGQARSLSSSPNDNDRLRLVEALDHLQHRSPEAASQALEPLLTRADELADPEVRIETLVLSATADLECERAFRASRLAERAVDDPSVASYPELQCRALLLLALGQARRGRAERVEALLHRALDMTREHELVEMRIEVANALAEFLKEKATRDPEHDDTLLARAREMLTIVDETIESVAKTLSQGRRPTYLTSRRHARSRSGDLISTVGTPTTTLRRLVATLSEISTLINSMTDLDALLDRVMDIALEIVGAERGLVVMFEPDADQTSVKAARNLDGQTMVDSSSISNNAIREAALGREVVTFDTAADPRVSTQHSVSLYSIRSLLCFPLRIHDRILGAVYLDNQKTVRVYGEEDLEFLRAFTNLAAIAIENSRLMGSLREENVFLKRVVGQRFDRDNIIGTGPKMERVFRLMEKAMDSTFPVLVTGETGTGKEVFTRAIHFGSPRRERPLVAQNCAAIPGELLESEMFGFRRGAFTGAQQDRKGLFETANGGTLFLDEIGELGLPLQAKLLRVLQDGKIRRLGENFERTVDVRIISATNRDLKSLVDNENFRLDLYYRLNVIQIELPALRERPEDIPLLAQHFLGKNCKEMNKEIRGFSRRAVEQLRQYSWPGNVRELENVIARAVVFCESQIIDHDDLPPMLTPAEQVASTDEPRSPGDGTPTRAARRVFDQIQRADGDFWKLVKKPFLARDLSRDVAREVVRLGLENGEWKYTRALTELGLPADEYRRFMNFLAKFNLKVERPR